MFRSITVFSTLLWLLGVSVTSLADDTPLYSATDLGTLGGNTVASGINSSGQVVGHSSNTVVGNLRAFLWEVVPE